MSIVDQAKAEYACDRCGEPLTLDEVWEWGACYHMELCQRCCEIMERELLL
jgi:hypothetical protein